MLKLIGLLMLVAVGAFGQSNSISLVTSTPTGACTSRKIQPRLNTSTGELSYCDGSAWQKLTGGGACTTGSGTPTTGSAGTCYIDTSVTPRRVWVFVATDDPREYVTTTGSGPFTDEIECGTTPSAATTGFSKRFCISGRTSFIGDDGTVYNTFTQATIDDKASLTSTNTFTGRQNATGAASTAPNKVGTSLPGTCTVGDTYVKTDATATQVLYVCTSTNTWTQQGGSSSVSATQPYITISGTKYLPQFMYPVTVPSQSGWTAVNGQSATYGTNGDMRLVQAGTTNGTVYGLRRTKSADTLEVAMVCTGAGNSGTIPVTGVGPYASGGDFYLYGTRGAQRTSPAESYFPASTGGASYVNDYYGFAYSIFFKVTNTAGAVSSFSSADGQVWTAMYSSTRSITPTDWIVGMSGNGNSADGTTCTILSWKEY
jgi:hypothetical protein